MKTTAFTLICLVLMLTGPTAGAQEQPLLGTSHYAVELDLMFLQHRTFETDDGGIYFGFAGYRYLGDDWYLGGEIGVGTAFGLFLVENSTYMPLEVNAKRAFALSRHWVATLGGGLSLSRVEYSHDAFDPDDDVDVTEWVAGGQVLSDLIYQAGGFQIGLKFKYQLTTNVDEVTSRFSPDAGWDYSNLKLGIQIGFRLGG